MIDMKQYGFRESEPIPEGLLPGRITALWREQYTVATPRGEVAATLKGSFYYAAELREDFPSVGDFVLLEFNESGVSRIDTLLPRRTKFSRADLSGHGAAYAKTILEQVVATNFDYIFIVSSLNNDFNVGRILRYLTQARKSGGIPVVVLTKSDLCPDSKTYVTTLKEAAPDVAVYAVSSHTGEGLDSLSQYLSPGNTIVFLGMSGVGKSSLLNTLMGEDVMDVKAIREDDSRGRHTTTHRQLFLLPSGAMVIDTPGMRELGLFDVEDGLSMEFSDIEDLFPKCRFGNCHHETEPGCAVLAAIADGSLSRDRYTRYLAQKKEARYAEDKTGYLEERKAWSKSIAKKVKNINKNRY